MTSSDLYLSFEDKEQTGDLLSDNFCQRMYQQLSLANRGCQLQVFLSPPPSTEEMRNKGGLDR